MLINPYVFGNADPLFSSVVLLLHGDGANDSTSIVDSSSSAKTITAFGNARISSVQSRFGGTSLFVDGSGDYFRVTPVPDFGFGSSDFTIETWLYRVGTGQQHLYEARRTSVTNRMLLYLNASGQLTFYANGSNVITTTSVPPLQQWCHVAACRSSGTTRLFLNGSQVGSSYSDSVSYSAPSDYLVIGANDAVNGSFLNGYLDEFRVTRAARYSSAFSVPTAPFPDS